MQFVRYLGAGALAALANYGSRFVFSLWLPFEVAVVLAFGVGLASGFVLMRGFAFRGSGQPVARQALWYLAVNLLALVQTLAVSLLLARWLLPPFGLAAAQAEAIAHAAGVGVPVITSYLGHKYFTFQ